MARSTHSYQSWSSRGPAHHHLDSRGSCKVFWEINSPSGWDQSQPFPSPSMKLPGKLQFLGLYSLKTLGGWEGKCLPPSGYTLSHLLCHRALPATEKPDPSVSGHSHDTASKFMSSVDHEHWDKSPQPFLCPPDIVRGQRDDGILRPYSVDLTGVKARAGRGHRGSESRAVPDSSLCPPAQEGTQALPLP